MIHTAAPSPCVVHVQRVSCFAAAHSADGDGFLLEVQTACELHYLLVDVAALGWFQAKSHGGCLLHCDTSFISLLRLLLLSICSALLLHPSELQRNQNVSRPSRVQEVSRRPDLAGDGIDEMFMRAEGADGSLYACVCTRPYRQF